MQINEMNFVADISNENVIVATGKQGELGVDTSSILTRLIQEAGRYCKHNASDLFIIWSLIQKKMKQNALQTRRHLFGFREDGVDEIHMTLTRYNKKGDYIRNHYIASLEYRSVWVLDVETQDNGYVEMKLFEACKVPRIIDDPTLPCD